MQSDLFSEKLENQFELCLKHLSAFCIKRNAEDLHQFRVSVKKIRALLILAKACDKEFRFKSIITDLKSIYRQAALIRNQQVITTLLKQNWSTCPEKHLTAINSQVEYLISKFIIKQVLFENTIVNISASCLKFYPKINKPLFAKVIRKYINQISDAVHSKITPSKFHELRKQLKILLYIVRFSENKNYIDSEQLKLIDGLQNSIGQWHDMKMLSIFLKQREIIMPAVKLKQLTQKEKIKTEEIYSSINILKYSLSKSDL